MSRTESEVKDYLSKIIISKIERIEKHPDADKLQICFLNVGDTDIPADLKNEEGLVQVLTAAPNVNKGDIVPFLPSGQIVPGFLFKEGKEIRLESRKMRGEYSYGMILAKDEIGIGDDHEGIMILNDLASDDLIGKSILEILNDDQIKFVNNLAGVIEIDDELKARIDLIKSVADEKSGGEIVGLDELPAILTSGDDLITYDGFEPSGQMHIAQGVIRAINTNKMIEAGFTFKMWVADWFGYLNNKMGGDLEKIKVVGEYFIEIWRAAGMNLDGVQFLWTSDFVGEREYWETVMKVSKHTNLKRILRTTEIMGRSEQDDLSAAQILYPAMQITDIFKVMKCQVTQLGMDQRKVNMLAREIGPDLGFWKPVVVSHGMLQGLGKPLPKDADPTERAISMKMSKSKPDTAIFLTDSEKDVKRKITKAYCPERVVEDNPVLAYVRQIIFESNHLVRENELLDNGVFKIEREEKFGGDIEFDSYDDLEKAYESGDLFPLDLKNAVIKYLNELLKPVREHFENDPRAKKILEQVKSFKVTR